MQERQYEMKQVLALAEMSYSDAAKMLHVHPITMGKYVRDAQRLTLGQARLLAEAAGIGVEQIKL